MASERFEVGDILEICTMRGKLEGVCTLNNGDQLVYLGNSQAKVTTGQSKGWLVTLAIDAPVILIKGDDERNNLLINEECITCRDRVSCNINKEGR